MKFSSTIPFGPSVRWGAALLPLVLPLLSACDPFVPGDDGAPAGNGDGGTRPDGGGAGVSGVPCDVAKVLQASCTSCHGAVPSGGAPVSLVTYADLTKQSPKGGTFAQRSLIRMMDAASPMPPSGLPPAADVATFQTWVNGGATAGTCMDPGGTDPFSLPPLCPSKWTGGNKESPFMNPGKACIACHVTDKEAPTLSVAGTVYSTGHEPDLCNAPSVTGATVEVTGAGNVVRNLTVNRVGNFYSKDAALKAPFKIRVLYQGRVRAMGGQAQSGDCNSCHTEAGANKAPGRVVLP